MNSSFRPLPSSMLPLQRGFRMVERGEFKTLSEAMSHLSSLRKKKPAKSTLPSQSAPVSTYHPLPTGNRLPYNDD